MPTISRDVERKEVTGARADRAWIAAALLLALLPYLALVWRFDFLSDDAFINFRYAKNLADGYGLRFNPGSGDAVEGYNCLWTVMCAVPELFGLNTPQLSKLGTLASAIVLLWSVLACARRDLGVSPLATLATGLVLVCTPPFAVWATSGMETMPTALFMFLTWRLLLGDPLRPRGWSAGVCAAITALMRPDGMVLAAIVLVAAGLTWARFRQPGLLRACVRCAALLTLCVALHTAWRLWYHGDWISNTARIKGQMSILGLQRGWDYACTLLLAFPGLLLVLALATQALGRELLPRSLSVLLIVCALLAYMIAVGADFMPMGRFLLAALPFFALAFALAMRAFELRARPRAWVVVCAAACIALSLPAAFDRHVVPHGLRERHDFRWGQGGYTSEFQAWRRQKDNADRWTREGLMLARETHFGQSLVRGPIGAVGYFTDLHLYDLFGLTDREVARLPIPPRATTAGHTKEVSPAFFLKYAPTFIGTQLTTRENDQHLLFSIDGSEYAHGLMEWIERRELRVEDGFGPEQGYAENSRLLMRRLVPLSADFDLLLPLVRAAEGVSLEDPQLAEAELWRRFPPESPAAQRIAARIGELWRNPTNSPLPPATSVDRPPRTNFDWLIEVWWCDGLSLAHKHPEGEINLLLVLEGNPTFHERVPGYVAMKPGSTHTPIVEGGTLGVVTLRRKSRMPEY